MRQLSSILLLAMTPVTALSLLALREQGREATSEKDVPHTLEVSLLAPPAPATQTPEPPIKPLPCQVEPLAAAHAWLSALIATDYKLLRSLQTPETAENVPALAESFVIETWEPDGDTAVVFAHLTRTDPWGTVTEPVALHLEKRNGYWYIIG